MATTNLLTGGAAELYKRAKATSEIQLGQYPSDLHTINALPYARFSVYDSVARGGQFYGSIDLYLPPTLKVRYNTQYEEVSLDVEKWTSGMGNAIAAAYGGDLAQVGSIFARGGANILSQATGANATDSLEKLFGQTINPHMALLFRGVGFRDFQFDFQMMARNESESKSIRDIIYRFKYHMHPRYSGNYRRYMEYPEDFTIEFYTPSQEYMFKVNRCVLTGMEVDYAGSGVPSFFSSTGAPVDIRMTLQFKELAIVTKDGVEQGS